MKRNILGVAAIISVSAWASSPMPQEAAEAAAIASAEAWLAKVDAGKYAESWQEAAEIFRSAVAKEKWLSMVAAVRQPLGKVGSRKLISKKYTESLPNAPAGKYVVLQFETSFENKKGAVETITPMLDKDGTWRVSGYFVR
jgi:hypothetical protein